MIAEPECQNADPSSAALMQEIFSSRNTVATLSEVLNACPDQDISEQTILNVAQTLQLRQALCVLESDVILLNSALVTLAKTHQHTPMLARAGKKFKLPTTFGMKAATWLDLMLKQHMRLSALAQQVLVLPNCGEGASLQRWAEQLQLHMPDICWQTQAERLVDVASVASLLVASMAKIARDVSSLCNVEIAELREPKHMTLSDAKHDADVPASGSARVTQLAARVPELMSRILSSLQQEHEPQVSQDGVEWDVLREILQLTATALTHLKYVVEGLQVNAMQMASHLEKSYGNFIAEAISLALVPQIGWDAAQQHIDRARETAGYDGKQLRDVMVHDAEIQQYLTTEQLASLLNPGRFAGQAVHFVDKVLNTWRIQNNHALVHPVFS